MNPLGTRTLTSRLLVRLLFQARVQRDHGFATTAHTSAPTVNYSNDSQDALVNSLVQQGLLTRGGRVEGVMRAVDRRDFTSTHLGIPPHISYMVRPQRYCGHSTNSCS